MSLHVRRFRIDGSKLAYELLPLHCIRNCAGNRAYCTDNTQRYSNLRLNLSNICSMFVCLSVFSSFFHSWKLETFNTYRYLLPCSLVIFLLTKIASFSFHFLHGITMKNCFAGLGQLLTAGRYSSLPFLFSLQCFLPKLLMNNF